MLCGTASQARDSARIGHWLELSEPRGGLSLVPARPTALRDSTEPCEAGPRRKRQDHPPSQYCEGQVLKIRLNYLGDFLAAGKSRRPPSLGERGFVNWSNPT